MVAEVEPARLSNARVPFEGRAQLIHSTSLDKRNSISALCGLVDELAAPPDSLA
jgi:hypothetical protein